MKDKTHLTEDELIKQLIDSQSLTPEKRDHFRQCNLCQKQNDSFSNQIQHADQIITATQSRQEHARRTFWTTTASNSKKWQTNTGRFLVGATICALLSFLILPLTSQSPEKTFTLVEQSEASAENTSLLQFASALLPDTEIMEPELISFIQPQEYESTNDQFSDFISFISSASQEQS